MYKYKPLNKDTTTTNRHRQTWIVPQDQVREFLSGPINYDKLIENCLKEYVVAAINKSKKDRGNAR